MLKSALEWGKSGKKQSKISGKKEKTMKVKQILARLLSATVLIGSLGICASASETPTLNWTENTSATVALLTGDTYTYFNTLNAALAAAQSDTSAQDTFTIECKTGADVGALQHATVTKNLIINGNGAHISNAKENNEHDMGFDTYAPLTKDISVKVYSLDGIAAWGERETGYTLNLYFENCKNMNRVYLSSKTGIGTNNITLKDCSFDSSEGSHQNTSVYSNSKGDITIENCTFKGIGCPINLNNKSNGAQTVSVKSSTFTDCSTAALQAAEGGSAYFAPIRLVVSKSGSTSATIDTCQITGNESSHGDILLGDGREGKASSDKLSATVKNTAATIKIEDPEKETRTITSSTGETITANAAVRELYVSSVDASPDTESHDPNGDCQVIFVTISDKSSLNNLGLSTSDSVKIELYYNKVLLATNTYINRSDVDLATVGNLTAKFYYYKSAAWTDDEPRWETTLNSTWYQNTEPNRICFYVNGALVEDFNDIESVKTDNGFKADYPTYTAANGSAEAEMGDKLYKSFSGAIAAAKDGDTIKLLKDADCEAIDIANNTFSTGLTIDLGGHKLNIIDPMVGSTGTKTNALRFGKGNKITLQNGEITTSVAKHLIQNYSDLTLKNIKLDGSNLVWDGNQYTYTVSHSCGALSIDRDCEIIAEEHGFAFDVSEWSGYMGATATVESGATISGKIELKNYDAGATFTGKLTDGSGHEYTEQGNYVQNGSAFLKVGSLQKVLVIYNMRKTERENGGESGNYYPVHIYAAVDELSYREVGFYVTAKNTATNQEKAIKKSIKTVYTQMNVTDHNGNKTEYGEDKFGAKYIFGHELLFDASAWSNENTEIKVKPYAIKLDGGEITGDTITITDAIIKAQNSASALFNTEED